MSALGSAEGKDANLDSPKTPVEKIPQSKAYFVDALVPTAELQRLYCSVCAILGRRNISLAKYTSVNLLQMKAYFSDALVPAAELCKL